MNKRILELELQKSKIKTNNIMWIICSLLFFPCIILWAFDLASKNSKRKKIDQEIAYIRLYENSLGVGV